jgi:hypothetical protein
MPGIANNSNRVQLSRLQWYLLSRASQRDYRIFTSFTPHRTDIPLFEQQNRVRRAPFGEKPRHRDQQSDRHAPQAVGLPYRAGTDGERAKPWEMSPPPVVEETNGNCAFRPSFTLRRPEPPSPTVLRALVRDEALLGEIQAKVDAYWQSVG